VGHGRPLLDRLLGLPRIFFIIGRFFPGTRKGRSGEAVSFLRASGRMPGKGNREEDFPPIYLFPEGEGVRGFSPPARLVEYRLLLMAKGRAMTEGTGNQG